MMTRIGVPQTIKAETIYSSKPPSDLTSPSGCGMAPWPRRRFRALSLGEGEGWPQACPRAKRRAGVRESRTICSSEQGWPRRLALVALAAAVALGGLLTFTRAERAAAHPLGNFTINRYSHVQLTVDGVTVRYVLDIAEIPAFQERSLIDTDGDGAVSATERDAYLDALAGRIGAGLHLTIDGQDVALMPVETTLSFPPGQAGLDTQRVVIDYVAALPEDWEDARGAAEFVDENYADRIGWREVIVTSLDGVSVVDASVPSQDLTHELTTYPKDLLSDPLAVTSATFGFEPGAGAGGAPLAQPATAPVGVQVRTRENGFTSLIESDELSFAFIAGAMFVALGFGALHALGPGHGKTIVAAFLVGERGNARHALLLGLTVTATHTVSVFALGVITLNLSAFIVPERLYPWLTLLSGLLVAGLGGALLLSRLQALRRKRTHEHELAHAHGGHSHALPGTNGSPVAWKSLLALGVSGGILPCPSALVVLLGAISLHRVGLGLLLVVAFSVGLATVLTGIGLALVWVGRLASRSKAWDRGRALDRFSFAPLLVRALPSLSALAITAVGAVMTARAVMGEGGGFGL